MMILDPGSPVPPETLSAVWCGDSLAQAQEYALVILAMNLTCQLEREPEAGGFALRVDPQCADAIAAELATYRNEQLEGVEDVAVQLPRFSAGAWITFLWVLSLLLVFHLQRKVPELTETALSSNVALLERGEWWRPCTALFLHGDLEHLIGNIGFGVLFCTLVARSLGALLGWFLVFAAGICGNVLTALAYHPVPFASLGASTAVFGALGILTGYGFYVAFRSPANAPWASIVLPIGGGLSLLGWLGVGGPGTDILGHLSGFTVGIPLGIAAAWWRLRSVISRRRPLVANPSPNV